MIVHGSGVVGHLNELSFFAELRKKKLHNAFVFHYPKFCGTSVF